MSLKGKACLKTKSAIWSFSRNLFMRDANLKQLLSVKYKALHTWGEIWSLDLKEPDCYPENLTYIIYPFHKALWHPELGSSNNEVEGPGLAEGSSI